MPLIALLLLRPLARAVDWVPVAVTVPVGVALALVVDAGGALEPGHGLLLLRMIAVLLAAAAAFALVDGMAVTTGAVPVPRWARQWTRTLMVGAAVAGGWGLTYAVVAVRLPQGAPNLAGAAVEATVCVLAGLAGAAPAVRRNHGRPAALAGAVTLLTLYAATQLTGGAWPAPGTPAWNHTHTWWLATLPLPLLTLLTAHRDVR